MSEGWKKMEKGLVGYNGVRLDKYKNIKFNLCIYINEESDPIAVIYGCAVKESREGVKFISYPSYKGSDGNYYKNAWADLTEDEQEWLIKEVSSISKDEYTSQNIGGGRRGRH